MVSGCIEAPRYDTGTIAVRATGRVTARRNARIGMEVLVLAERSPAWRTDLG